MLRQVGWASVPILSIGFLSFVPFFALALIQRRRRDWAVFAAYLAATVAMIVAIAAVNSNSGAGAGVGGFIVVLAGCAAVHAGVMFRPSRSLQAGAGAAVEHASPPVQPSVMSAEQRNRDAIRHAQDRLERRKQARHLAQTNPALARDLRIGRPDLPRDYDDGGLVNVNEVPGDVLSAQLGLNPQEVTDVIAARGKLGKLGSADELCAYTSLPPDRVDELRDLMIFS